MFCASCKGQKNKVPWRTSEGFRTFLISNERENNRNSFKKCDSKGIKEKDERKRNRKEKNGMEWKPQK